MRHFVSAAGKTEPLNSPVCQHNDDHDDDDGVGGQTPVDIGLSCLCRMPSSAHLGNLLAALLSLWVRPLTIYILW